MESDSIAANKEGAQESPLIVPQFHSVGHSNRRLEEFIEILTAARIELLVDVRSFPRSRSNPAFNIDCLPSDLAKADIDYKQMRSLGGRRSKQPNIDEHINALWHVRAFHNYADYALSNEFSDAFALLLQLGRGQRLAIMCSEAVWWRCHRRIIVDYLLASGQPVDHLMGVRHTDHATMTPGARITANGKVVYPATHEE